MIIEIDFLKNILSFTEKIKNMKEEIDKMVLLVFMLKKLVEKIIDMNIYNKEICKIQNFLII